MNITKLKISGYKNLNIELEHDAKVITLIGNNGSGKSNLLEALSTIFRYLYLKKNQTPFDYRIEYNIKSGKDSVVIHKNSSAIEYLVNGYDVASIEQYLPKRVIAIYSGESNRLWKESYEVFYKNTIKSIYSESKVEMPKLLLINKYYWQISLITLILSEQENDKTFLKERLGIDEINNIRFDINKDNYRSYPDSMALNVAKALEVQEEYTLEELKETLASFTHDLSALFSYLYILFTPKKNKIIQEIIVLLNNKRLTIDSLSEGEKKLLLLKSAFEFAVQEDSLFLLDEPDAHIHVNNKEQIIELIRPFKHNRQVVLTTHSPTVTKSIDNDELFMVDKGMIIDKKEQEIIDHLTGDFWNRHQQGSFLSSDKDIILLVEGKHDKIHLENAFSKLKDDFSDLDFDIFSLGGESKIQPFMNGLYETNSWHSKLYIAIYDDDKAGRKPFEKSFEKVSNKGYRKLTCNLASHNNFYAIALTRPEGFHADCTIESMFEPDKYQDAYKSTMNSYKYFANKSIEEINKDIKEESKNLLAEKSKQFNKEDFKYFRPLFKLIEQIKNDCITPSNEKIQYKDIEQASDLESDTEEVNEDSDLVEVFYKNAVGLYNPENHHLTVKEGSKIRKGHIPSFSQGDIENREALIEILGYEENGNSLTIYNDHEFTTPSGAGKFVFASNVNGKKVWKNSEGLSLKELFPN